MSVAAALGSVGDRPAVRHLLTTLANPVVPISPGVRAELSEWSAVLRRLRVSPEVAEDLARRAEHDGTTLPEELLASGRASEENLYRQVAVKFGVAFSADLSTGELRTDARSAMALLTAKGLRIAQLIGADGFVRYVAAPDADSFLKLRDMLRRDPSLMQRISLVQPSVLRRALIDIAEPVLRDAVCDGLFTSKPQLSARLVTSGWQGFFLGALCLAVSGGLVLWATVTWLALHICATLFFFMCIVLRIAAVLTTPTRSRKPANVGETDRWPMYSVLIALKDEVEVIPELITSLGKLQWPRARLEIKFICECDDRPTIDALRAHALRPWVEIVEVPRGMLTTKPNALTYGLALSKGEFVAVYDAEDRPHPLQLREAWQRFAGDEPDLACLQAPIDVDNGDANILARMFELEYAALFHRLLPYLAHKRMPLPLGGTSNHFRRSALDEIGGWDPYNVTEDADLGVRLARYGYRTGVIYSPTGEDAPEKALVWLKQRTRWLKGWAQTWLVHMRDPRLLISQIGFRSFVAIQILLAGLLASALLHPALLITGLYLSLTATAHELSSLQRVLFMFDMFNLAFGYGAFLLLGWRATPPHRRRGFWKLVIFTPFYWVMMSVAAWRACLQLRTKPHLWEKTPHKRHRHRPMPTMRPRPRAAGVTLA